MSVGIENASIVDLVTLDAKREEYALIMVATEPWNNERALALQSKIEAYLNFVESGAFVGSYPEARGKRIRFQLNTTYPPTDIIAKFVNHTESHWLAPHGIRFVVQEMKQ